MTALQCTNTGRHEKSEIHSGFTTFLQPRFGTLGLLVVLKLKTMKGQSFLTDREVQSSCAHGYAANQNLSLRSWIAELKPQNLIVSGSLSTSYLVLKSNTRSIDLGLPIPQNHELEDSDLVNFEPRLSDEDNTTPLFYPPTCKREGDHRSLMVKVMDSWLAYHGFEPSTTED
ncbi:hypothetical protein TNCV_1373531 [Trichonephila clavipes]|uniref:Uncharacterized protein n=1 Tax=Trichonephila clavipes TaxID=2585209 RepID=A0A8X6WHK6_TRICX|nr:hypothetical protein TNCV_1373531 [Trichonephila clavipes]